MDRVTGMAWLFFSPSGRISRAPYALGLAFWFALQIAAIGQLLAGDRLNSDGLLIISFVALIIAGLVGTVSMLMLTIKRVHDLGHPGMLAFLIIVPVVSFFALVFFLLIPSGPPNDYGYYTNRPR